MDTQTTSTRQATLNIGGMACNNCANTVKEALTRIEDVSEASVDLENDSALVTFDPDSVSTDDFRQAVEDAGYEFKGTSSSV